MKLKTVTITGADNNTDIDKMIEISKKYPFVEWGILFSPLRNLGKGESRYPNGYWLTELQNKCANLNLNFSAHLCGGYTREMLNFGTHDNFTMGWPSSFLPMFNRIQLNFNASKNNVCDEFYSLLSTMSCANPEIILQHNFSNKEVNSKVIFQKKPVHFQKEPFQFLYDSSGGNGKTIEYICPIIPNHFTGYSGGLNPDNISEILMAIEKGNSDADKATEFWVDTETGVRTDDILDFEKVNKFLEICSKHIGSSPN